MKSILVNDWCRKIHDHVVCTYLDCRLTLPVWPCTRRSCKRTFSSRATLWTPLTWRNRVEQSGRTPSAFQSTPKPGRNGGSRTTGSQSYLKNDQGKRKGLCGPWFLRDHVFIIHQNRSTFHHTIRDVSNWWNIIITISFIYLRFKLRQKALVVCYTYFF